MRTHTHTQHTHTHTHACTCARTHARMHAHQHTRMHAQACTLTHTQTRIHTRAHAHTHTLILQVSELLYGTVGELQRDARPVSVRGEELVQVGVINVLAWQSSGAPKMGSWKSNAHQLLDNELSTDFVPHLFDSHEDPGWGAVTVLLLTDLIFCFQVPPLNPAAYNAQQRAEGFASELVQVQSCVCLTP